MFHEDDDMDAQLQRTLTGALCETADLGEAIATALRVKPGDYDGWHDEWLATGERARTNGEVASAAGNIATARQAYLRAAECFRQAGFFLRHDLADARVKARYRDHVEAFEKGAALLPYEVERVEIAFDPSPITGHHYRIDDEPRPVILFPGGFDGTEQEFFKLGAAAALTRGWNALAWDGPGQGRLLIEDGVVMRPDFESVLAPVVDWVVARPSTDAARIAVVGRSLGGYLAPRGVSGEPRVAALVCDPGQFDFLSRFGMSADDWQKVLARDPDMVAQLQGFLDGPRNTEFWGSRMAAMGATDYADWMRICAAFTLEGRVTSIACPTLVTEGEGDFASQSHTLFDALTCEKTFHGFTASEGAAGHCEGLGFTLWAAVAFDWLAGIFARDPDAGKRQPDTNVTGLRSRRSTA